MNVDLPEPEGPHDGDELALLDLEGHRPQCVDHTGAAAIILDQINHLDDRFCDVGMTLA